MRAFAIAMILAALAAPAAFAADHWHRDGNGGQDLTQPDGTVVGMVRKRDEGWVGFVAQRRGGEDFDTTGPFHTMREAKLDVADRLHSSDAEDER